MIPKCDNEMFGDKEEEESLEEMSSDEEDAYEEEQAKKRMQRKKKKQQRVEDSDEESEEESDDDDESDNDSNEGSDDDDDDDDEPQEPMINSNVSSKNKSNTSRNEDWETVTVTHRIHGSMSDFATDSKKCFSEISEFSKKIFNDRENDGKENSSHQNHILAGMRLVKAKNPFRCTIQLSLEGVDQKDQKDFSAQGKGIPGVATLYPKESVDYSANPVQIVKGNANSSNSRFLKEYPGWNSDNLDEGIQYIKDAEGKCLIKMNHPVVGVFNELRRENGEKPLNEKNMVMNGFYEGEEKAVKKCLDMIRENLDENLQIKNLNNLKFKINRAFTKPTSVEHAQQWNDKTEFETLTDHSHQNMLKEKGDLLLTVEYKFKNV